MIHVEWVASTGDGWWEWICDDCGMNAPFHYRDDAQDGAEVHEIYAHWPLKTWRPTSDWSGWYSICQAMRPRPSER